MRSSLLSRPTLRRTRSALTPAAMSSSSFIWRWVELAGWRQQVLASATWVAMAPSLRDFIKVSAAFRPPFTPKDTTPQEPLGRYFRAVS